MNADKQELIHTDCECGAHVLRVEYDKEDNFYYLTIYGIRAVKEVGFIKRFKMAIGFLFNKKSLALDSVVLEEKAARDLQNFIYRNNPARKVKKFYRKNESK